jgi:hypothetical protein
MSVQKRTFCDSAPIGTFTEVDCRAGLEPLEIAPRTASALPVCFSSGLCRAPQSQPEPAADTWHR